jgi:hypothetical protein
MGDHICLALRDEMTHMVAAFERRLAVICFALCAITVVSWWIGSHHNHHVFTPDGAVTFSVIAIAAVKVRIIVSEFMEARYAPPLLRRIADAWLSVLVATLLAIYVIGMGSHV